MRRAEPSGRELEESEVIQPRLFLREPGWKVGLKQASDREFCFNVHPGEEAHHRLAAGEMYIFSADEKLCLPCADRRGLLVYEPKPLRKTVVALPVPPGGGEGDDGTIPVLDRHGVNAEEDHEPPSVRG